MKCRGIAVLCGGLVMVSGLAALADEPAATAAPVAPAEASIITTLDLSPVYAWTNGDFETQFAPEIEAEKGKVEWKKNVKLVNNVCDFITELGQTDNAMVYARVILDASEACKVHLSMGSDDGLTVFANGKKVLANNVKRSLSPDTDQADIDLAKGRNEVMFRVTQGDGGWLLQVVAKVVGNAKVTQVAADDKPAAPAAAPAAGTEKVPAPAGM